MKKSTNKPRKRRTQTLAEKGTVEHPVLYRWAQMLDSYTFEAPNVDARLTHQGDVWFMAVKINGKNYVGNRPTLEDAFKATDRLIFLHTKDIWAKSDSSALLEPWKGVLNDVA